MGQHKITLSEDETCFFAGEDETILQAAKRQNIHLPYGCCSGSCFGCLQDLTSGEINYPQELLDNQSDLLVYEAMLCQGVAKSDIVLKGKQLPEDLSEDIPMKDDVAKLIDFDTDLSVSIQNFSPSQIGEFPVKVSEIKHLTGDVCRLVLKLSHWVEFSFFAGQYIDILLDNGLRRSFSIANCEQETKEITLYIKKIENGYFSDYVFHHLNVGAIWRIMAPLGVFGFKLNDKPKLVLASGTGIVPIYSILTSGNIDQSKIYLYWGVRHQSHLFLDDELKAVANQLDQLSYRPTISKPNSGWSGRTGYHYAIAKNDLSDLSLFDIYISGQDTVIHSFFEYCHNNKINTDNIVTDVFTYQH